MRWSVALLLLLAVVAAGCVTGDEESDASRTTTATTTTTTGSEEQRFNRANLPRLILPASSAPDGLKLAAAESGARSFDDLAPTETQKRELRGFGFVAAHDAIFDSTNQQQSDLRVVERLYLFKSPEGAGRWLQSTRAIALGLGMQSLGGRPLGDSSWAAAGALPDTDVVTHAFRVGNLVVQVSSQTQRAKVSREAALAAALAAEERILG